MFEVPSSPARQAETLTESVRDWPAHLELGFSCRAGSTIATHRRHRGPYRVQRSLHPEGPAVCQQILLHPPGGVAGGDRLRLDLRAEQETHVQITTPGAGKWYRSGGQVSGVEATIRAESGATVEWLPQETIVFDGADVRQNLSIRLESDALFLGWEILALGRSASGERFLSGSLEQGWEILRDGKPVAWEAGELRGGDPLLRAAPGWDGALATGTFWACSTGLSPDDSRDASVLHPERGIGASTPLPGLLVARFLGPDPGSGRDYFERLWRLLRPRLCGRDAVPPRIWRT